jgi:hypothetical protein
MRHSTAIWTATLPRARAVAPVPAQRVGGGEGLVAACAAEVLWQGYFGRKYSLAGPFLPFLILHLFLFLFLYRRFWLSAGLSLCVLLS